MKTLLEDTLLLAAFGQVCIAALNYSLIRIMGWREPLERLPLLVREVFQVHVWFISITLLIFAAFTVRFAGAMAAEPCRWMACAVGVFWAIRTVLQVVYYSGSHWHGLPGRTAVHITLLAVYGGFAAVYLTAGILG
ncbi:MAG TPA: hypothetical protein VHY22_08105 [Chthoniobacteraceae bacterium]|jgi:hypothetical protein|nr:hypothetical protein [Chthoniobacteraceae bacterium]